MYCTERYSYQNPFASALSCVLGTLYQRAVLADELVVEGYLF
jgi:hypothetical protein